MMTPCRILFVDDEPELLNGLSKALRKQRGRWDMVFAVGPEAALDELARGRFNVVVTDMRMPQIDGAQLLQRARDLDPAAFRIILSGYSDRESLLRSLPVAHQFFDKPCDLAELRAAIDRANQLHTLFESEAVRRAIGRIETVPSVPQVYHELTALLAQPDASIDAIGGLIERDPAMCARVMQLAGSAYFRIERGVKTAAEAVSRIGIDVVCGLALASHAFAAFAPERSTAFSIERMQEHSLQVAAEVRNLVDSTNVGEAFTAGIVHDIGELVIAYAMPAEYAEIEARIAATGLARAAAEREVLGTSHAEIGAYLLGLWGLPLSIISAVAQHDDATPAASLAAALRTPRA